MARPVFPPKVRKRAHACGRLPAVPGPWGAGASRAADGLLGRVLAKTEPAAGAPAAGRAHAGDSGAAGGGAAEAGEDLVQTVGTRRQGPLHPRVLRTPHSMELHAWKARCDAKSSLSRLLP